MAKRSKRKNVLQEPPHTQSSGPFNNPFAQLSTMRDELPATSRPAPAPTPRGENLSPSAGLESCGKLVVAEQKKVRGGKTVTRISGLPAELIESVTAAMKAELGCGATWENGDLLLLGALAERAQSWLDKEGARRVVVSGRSSRPTGIKQAREPRTAKSSETSIVPSRADLRPGLTVDIVLKADQATGALTRGEIQQILTKSPHHPHGIKVRLHDGQVGRVKTVIG